MSIERLYVIFTTWHMRLPYWFIAMIMIGIAILLIALFVISSKERKHKRLYAETNRKLKETQEEVIRITLELKNKEEEYVALNKKMITSNKKLQDKTNEIASLKGDILSLQTSISEYKNLCKIYEDEKKELLNDLHTRGENIVNLNKTIFSSEDKIQELKTENTLLKKNFDETRELLNKKKNQFNTLEESYRYMASQNEKLKDSNMHLSNELNDLKRTVDEQTSKYQLETNNLQLKLERRNKKIENLNDSIAEIKKDLKIVIEEKQLVERTLQEIQDKQEEKEQDKYTDKCIRLIEKIAKW